MKQPLRPLREVVPTCLILRSACTSGELDLHVEQHPWAFWSNEQGTNIWIQKYVLHDHTFVDIWMSALPPPPPPPPPKDADVFKCPPPPPPPPPLLCVTLGPLGMGPKCFADIYDNTWVLVLTLSGCTMQKHRHKGLTKMPMYLNVDTYVDTLRCRHVLLVVIDLSNYMSTRFIWW